MTYWICRFRTLDVTQLEERRRLIDSFVNAVTIFDDYILITFNYKEGSERVSFDEVKSSDLKSVGGPTCVDEKDAQQKCGSIKEKKSRLTKICKSFQKLRGERCK